MDSWLALPDKEIISTAGAVSQRFHDLRISTFHQACGYVHGLPYGYNTDRDELMILFEEQKGSCTTKHAVIATLAHELDLPVEKAIGIYAMTEAIVTGTGDILSAHDLPYLPMVHCFLSSGPHRVDLTEGNRNGKNRSLEEFLHTRIVAPAISAKEEYLLYRGVIQTLITTRPELRHVTIKQILHAREKGLRLLKAKVQ